MTNEASFRVNSDVGGVPTDSVVNGNILFSNLAGIVPTAWDFHYQAGSSGIDQGVTLVEVPDDKDGNERPCGSASDIGAYEYTGHCVPPSAPVGLRIL
ncbi:MAG TPA: choice-of-anchor Q domain-containing protein [Candidatus Tectomicrobia bacterium]|nr:choice-of-anchor Q domain-containing protein [Candidatus Tectomicrobia bacterium]